MSPLCSCQLLLLRVVQSAETGLSMSLLVDILSELKAQGVVDVVRLDAK